MVSTSNDEECKDIGDSGDGERGWYRWNWRRGRYGRRQRRGMRLVRRVLGGGYIHCLPLKPCSRSEVDVALDANCLVCGPVHSVSARFGIETDPSAFACARIEFGTVGVVHPNPFSKFLQPGQVWRVSVQRLPGGSATESPRRSAVLEPRRMAQRLSPQALGKGSHV